MRMRIAMAVLFLCSTRVASATPRKAAAHVTQTYRIDGKSVSHDDFKARLSTLKGHAEYHCKKTTFGGVVTFKARDANGHWFAVTQVSGSDRPSSIEPTKAPETPADPE